MWLWCLPDAKGGCCVTSRRTKHVDVLEYLLFLNVHDDFTYRVSFGESCQAGPSVHLSHKRGQHRGVGGQITVELICGCSACFVRVLGWMRGGFLGQRACKHACMHILVT